MSSRDRVAAALAVGVAVFVVILGCSVLWATVDREQNVTAEVSSLVSAIVGGVVGALAVYLGGTTPPDPPRPPTLPDDPPWSDDEQRPGGDYPP